MTAPLPPPIKNLVEDFRRYLLTEVNAAQTTTRQYTTVLGTMLRKIDFPSDDSIRVMTDPQLVAYCRNGFEGASRGHLQSAWKHFRDFAKDPSLPEMGNGHGRLQLLHPLAYDIANLHRDLRWYDAIPPTLTWAEFLPGARQDQQFAATRILRFFAGSVAEVDASEPVLPLLPGTSMRLPTWVVASIRQNKVDATGRGSRNRAQLLQHALNKYLAEAGSPVDLSIALYRTFVASWESIRRRDAERIFEQWHDDFTMAIDRKDYPGFYGLLEKFTGVNPHSKALESILF